MSYRGSGYGRGDGRSRDDYRGNSRFNNQTSTRGYYPPKYEKDHSNRNLGHTGQNGYYNQQFSGDYYTRSNDDQYNNGYLPQQYNRSQPYTPSAKLSTSNEPSYKDRGRNRTEVPSSRKESGVAKNYSSSKQIVKNYNFTDKTQGNLISQLNAMTAFSDNAMKSFRTSYSKDPQNSNKKKAFLEYTDVCSSKLDDPKISEMYYKMLTKPQSKPVDKIYLPIFKYDKNSLAEKPSNEILIWNLHSGTTSLFIINNFSKYGKINECKLIDDPLTAVPMGMCLLSFDGKVEQAHMVALKAVEETNKQLIIHGRCIRSALNIKNKIYDEIYKKTMEVRAEMSRKKKLEELEKEKKARREEYRLAQEAELNRQKLKEKLPLAPKSTANSNGQMISGSLLANKQKEHVDSSVKPSKQSVHDNHIVPLSTIVLSFKLQRLVQNRPVIFIADKYVSSLHVSSDQIRRHLSRYSINRVLQQRNGFFLIFNSLNEAMTCFDNEDGKKFMRYTTYMTLYVPDGQIDDTRVGESGTLKLAQKEIMKELNAYFFKDIREKIIGQKVLEILNNDEIERLAETALERKRADEDAYQSQVKSTIEKPLNEIDTISFKPETVRIVNNFDINSLQKNRVSKKSFVPMSHSLNGIQSDESDDDEEEEEDEEENDNDNDEVAVKVGAAAANIPSPKSASSTTANEINDANNNGGKKRKNNDIAIKDSKRKKKKTATNKESTIESETLNDEIDEDDANGDVNSITNSAESQITSPEYDLKPLTPVPTIMDEFQPSTKLGPVYDESEFLPTLDHLKNCIKTDEDFRILSELCKDIQINEPIKDLNFWAWEHLELVKESLKLKEDKEEEYGDNTEKFDFEEEVLNSNELKNTTGSFRTQGYHKIPDKHKAQYMLHRRKLTNLNPVKNEDTDERNAQTHNNVQSSRVNRANTRRFVADISAQKQIIGETDLLDLNQLNKRKKPVIFARSAIHNWGLYALEPISAGEMIIEYVGERIRQQVAEVREKNYLRSGIGSSYLFRVDENTVIDASKKGGIARFINHCCEPSCTAKIIKVGGKKRIVIYALRDVKKNEELTYDYKFEREINDEERIPCLCGAPGCKGYLN